jgi:hypothetical protein
LSDGVNIEVKDGLDMKDKLKGPKKEEETKKPAEETENQG